MKQSFLAICHCPIAVPGNVKFDSPFTINRICVTLLHSERPKLYTILAFLSAIGLNSAPDNKRK